MMYPGMTLKTLIPGNNLLRKLNYNTTELTVLFKDMKKVNKVEQNIMLKLSTAFDARKISC